MKKYRILPLLLIVCLLLTAAFPAAAAKSTADNSADAPQSTANVSSDGVPQSTVQAAEGSYVLGSDAVKSALDEKLGANCVPVSYTHLDVYKRQGDAFSPRRRLQARLAG